MTRAFILSLFLLLGINMAQAQSLDDPSGGAIDLGAESELPPTRKAQSSQPQVGRKAAEKYMAPNTDVADSSRRAVAMSQGDHYLALHVGRFFSDNAYMWSRSSQEDVGTWNAGITYRVGEWINSMDLTLRIDLSQFEPDNGRATKLSFLPLVTFPDASSRFPLYFGAGAGLGVFMNQIGKESSLSLDYQLVGGVRFFEVMETTGFFIEGGIKNHLLLLSDGQFNGAFMAVGTVFTF